MKIECPNCKSERLQIVICQTAIYNPTAPVEKRVSPNFDEEVNREGGLVCTQCFSPIPDSEEIWETIEKAFQESLESE